MQTLPVYLYNVASLKKLTTSFNNVSPDIHQPAAHFTYGFICNKTQDSLQPNESHQNPIFCVIRPRNRINCAIMGVEAPVWQGARRANTPAYSTDEQHSQTGWIGDQNVKVILLRGLRELWTTASSYPVIASMTLGGRM